jgi:hypothetical protein
VSRWTAAGLAIELAAAACALAAYLLRDFDVGEGPEIEGAYFNRSEGAPAYAGVFEDDIGWFDPFSFSNPYLWLGAAVAFALAGAAILVMARLGGPARG